jgi:hypothetical protein
MHFTLIDQAETIKLSLLGSSQRSTNPATSGSSDHTPVPGSRNVLSLLFFRLSEGVQTFDEDDTQV